MVINLSSLKQEGKLDINMRTVQMKTLGLQMLFKVSFSFTKQLKLNIYYFIFSSYLWFAHSFPASLAFAKGEAIYN